MVTDNRGLLKPLLLDSFGIPGAVLRHRLLSGAMAA
jgi:hypothetical protein